MRRWESVLQHLEDDLSEIKRDSVDAWVTDLAECASEDVKEMSKWKMVSLVETWLFLTLMLLGMIGVLTGGNGLAVLTMAIASFGLIWTIEKR